MGTCVHRKGNGETARYRLWTSISDRYLTEPLTREQMREYLIWRRTIIAAESIDKIDDDIMVASHRGTSSRFEQRDASEWDMEKNNGHVYSPVYDQPVVVSTVGELVVVGTLPPMSADEAMDLAARIMVAAVRASE